MPHSGILLALIPNQNQHLVFEKAPRGFDRGTLRTQYRPHTVVTLPFGSWAHILSLSDTKEERNNICYGYCTKNSHQKHFHTVEYRRNNIFFLIWRTTFSS